MAGLLANIQNTDVQLQQLYNTIQKSDGEYQEMFGRLAELWRELDDENKSSVEKMNIVLSGEYILTKLRTYITDEHFKVKAILARKDVSPSWIAVFKQRDATLATYGLKLNDLREDIEVLSKVAWFFQKQQI